MADEEACASTIGLSAKAGYQKLYPDMADEKSLWEAGADWIIDEFIAFIESRLKFPYNIISQLK